MILSVHKCHTNTQFDMFWEEQFTLDQNVSVNIFNLVRHMAFSLHSTEEEVVAGKLGLGKHLK